MIHIEFWLKNEKENINLLLPVTPSRYDLEHARTIETVEATAIGDINLTGHKRLRNISISGFFPYNEYIFTKSSLPFTNPFEYVKLIQRWIDDKAIIRFIIADETITKINAQFYIETIRFNESKESNKDIDYTIILREYRQMQVKKVEQNKKTALGGNRPRPQSPAPKKTDIYKVVAGDNLHKIARKMYGDASKWKKIYEANKSIIGSNPNLIYPNQVYIIPK